MRAVHKESGNIVVYLLGAIFLMGILVYMVKGSSMPGIGIDVERTAIKVTEVQQYGNELEKAVAFIINNGFSDTDIRFAHPNASSAYGTVTDIPARQVFAKEGGGATWRDPPQNVQVAAEAWIFSGRNRVTGAGTTDAVAKSVDLIAILPNVTKDFCMVVNSKNNITNPGNAPPVNNSTINVTNLFAGTYVSSGLFQDLGGGTYLNTKLEACVQGAPAQYPTATYFYYRVLLPR